MPEDTPLRKEDHISRIPALQLLRDFGWRPDETARTRDQKLCL